MSDPRRAEVVQKILDLLAGLPHGLALDIQTDVLAVSIGNTCYLAGGSLRHAAEQLGMVAENATRHILVNWGQIESVPAA